MTDDYDPDPVRFNAELIEEFRAHDGRLSGMFANSSLLVLTTTGSRTGSDHAVPIGNWTVDGKLVVVASGNASPTEPHWYRNLLADPEVGVELATPSGIERFAARARVVEGAERERLWPLLLEQAPFFADHQAQLDREIPLVVLERPAT